MPNHDGGHYFLTVLAPVRTDTMIDPVIGRTRSHQHMLAQKLALLPTGRQTAVSPADAMPSPFARNTQNHLARFAIINEPHFNGRLSDDALVSTVRGVDPLQPQAVDQLTTPYLLFAADLDAQVGDGEAALQAYTATLWRTMQPDLVQIFDHCIGFEGTDTPEKFHAYLKACQVETTLPFNDYWAYGMDLGATKPQAGSGAMAGFLKWGGRLALGALIVWLVALAADGLFIGLGANNILSRVAASVTGWGAAVLLVLILLAAFAAAALYGWVMRRGAQPFPTAPDSDLPSILKGLFLQQAFTRLAIETQGLDDDALHARFGAFLEAVKPTASSPALTPGECHAPTVEWTR